jgi:hypothetical protein
MRSCVEYSSITARVATGSRSRTLFLGGPFWFDALYKLTNVRCAGRKPGRTDEPRRKAARK